MLKQVIVVRKDLDLSKGKTAAQVAHASLEAYKLAGEKIAEKWEKEGSKKVVLKAENLKELLEIKNKITKMKMPCALIKDAGLTEIQPGTVTCLGAGPAEEREINKVTGKLKML
jgi:PTH2 family peptidyl-tRNA hydrolase